MFVLKNLAFISLALVMIILQPLAVWSCATCGCSELCPLAMVQDTESNKSNKGALSDSLWGSNALTAGVVSGVVAGTVTQNIISLATLNPPAGQSDSYLPGALGLGLSGLTNIAFDGGMLVNWRLSKKIKARQLAIRNQVEAILNHLEFSEATCPEAQQDLAAIIGPQATHECLQLWRLSHTTATAQKSNAMSNANTKKEIAVF